MVHVLYNSKAGAHYSPEVIKRKIAEFFSESPITVTDTIEMENKQEYVSHLSSDDALVIVGGDGTLNRFVNAVDTDSISFPVYCYAGGTGNDFLNDVVGKDHDAPIQINEYIKNLPTLYADGKSYKFVNGIGYGLDGWCCDEGNRERAKTGKAPNYTKIALMGLLGKYKPTKARVTVDGVTSEYENVWMVSTMNGRYLGGGMKLTPEQDRLNPTNEVSVVVLTSKSRLRILTVFPKVFKGNHTKYTKVFKVIRGHEVSVEYERSVALQLDGETIPDLKKYSAKSASEKKEEATV